MSNKLLKLVAVVLSVGAFAYAGNAFAGVDGTPHDLGTELCAYCHTPHGATATAPLWNRTAPVTTVYTMYDSPTLSSGNKTVTTPQGVSLGCLSCHDGATAYNSLVTGTAGSSATMSGSKAVGASGDLSNDHPISVRIGATGIGGMNTVGSITGAGALTLYSDGTNSDLVECASCHDPHDNATATPFLRKSNANSAICTTCHTN